MKRLSHLPWLWPTLALLGCAPAPAPCPTVILASTAMAGSASPASSAAVAPPDGPLAAAYRADAARILAAARGQRAAYDKLRGLTDDVGHRLSGSPALDRAIERAERHLRADGHEGVRRQKVMVPHWERGAESAAVVAPVKRPLTILGLGGTVGTPKGGVEGEVLVVRSFEELERAGEAVKDKIVLYDVFMRPHDPVKGSAYGEVVPYRGSGPSRAAKLGAKAVLVRSLATSSLSTPHTGGTRYAEDTPKIPAAAITTEDAAFVARLAEKGGVRLRLELGAKTLPDAPSANVIAELRGAQKPEEIVLLAAHLDSWDVGQGAHDDGAGCVMVMQALTTLRQLGLKPKRTVRVVLFTNEENGLAGAIAYAKEHAAEVPKHVLGIEADSGGFAPAAFTVEVPKERADRALAAVRDIASLLEPVGQLKVVAHGSGADLIPLVKQGMLGVGYVTRGDRYFDLHHSAADTLDKVDPNELADGVAAIAVLAWVAADMPEPIAPP